MEKAINKAYFFFNEMYRIIILNFLFLVVNAFYFQVFFAIDFNVIYIPIYLVVSFTLIPSIYSLLYTNQKLSNGYGGSIVKKFVQSLLKFTKTNWKLIIVLLISFYFSIFNLYIIPSGNVFLNFIFAGNVTLIILYALVAINFIRVSIAQDYNADCLKISIDNFLTNLFSNFIVLVMNFFILFVSFKISFVSIIFIFGILTEINNRFINYLDSK